MNLDGNYFIDQLLGFATSLEEQPLSFLRHSFACGRHGARHCSGPPGDLAVPPNGGGGVRKITWLNGYCPQYPQLDILIYFFFSLLPRLGSASPPFLSRPRASCALFLSPCALLRCPSVPPLCRFSFSSLKAVAGLAQACFWQTTQRSVSQNTLQHPTSSCAFAASHCC